MDGVCWLCFFLFLTDGDWNVLIGLSNCVFREFLFVVRNLIFGEVGADGGL